MPTRGHILDNANLVRMNLGSSPMLSATANRQPQRIAAQLHSGERLGGADSPVHVV